MSLFAPLFEALGRTGGRYEVVGGVATVLHGFVRATADVDLAIDLAPAEVRGDGAPGRWPPPSASPGSRP